MWHGKLHVTEITRKSIARRSRRTSTQRATWHIHTTHYAPTFLPSPSPRAQLLSRVSLPLAPARGDRPVAATARTSCSWSISKPGSPMLLTAAADASRGREKERERDAVAQRCIGHPTDGACEHRQSMDCSHPPQWSRRLIGELLHSRAAHTLPAGNFHSVAYHRAACLPRREQRITTSARASRHARCSPDKAFPGASCRAGCSWNRSMWRVCESTTAAT